MTASSAAPCRDIKGRKGSRGGQDVGSKNSILEQTLINEEDQDPVIEKLTYGWWMDGVRGWKAQAALAPPSHTEGLEVDRSKIREETRTGWRRGSRVGWTMARRLILSARADHRTTIVNATHTGLSTSIAAWCVFATSLSNLYKGMSTRL